MLLMRCEYSTLSNWSVRENARSSGEDSDRGGGRAGNLLTSFRATLQELMHQGLVRHSTFFSHSLELREKGRGNPKGDELFRVPRWGPSYPAGAPKLFIREFRNIRVINLPIGHMPSSLCGTLASH
jgi:hypothetical protein